MAGEQTITARRGQPRVGNGSEDRVDAQERAHSWVDHANTRNGSGVDLGEGELAMQLAASVKRVKKERQSPHGKSYANGCLYEPMCTNNIISFEMKTW